MDLFEEAELRRSVKPPPPDNPMRGGVVNPGPAYVNDIQRNMVTSAQSAQQNFRPPVMATHQRKEDEDNTLYKEDDDDTIRQVAREYNAAKGGGNVHSNANDDVDVIDQEYDDDAHHQPQHSYEEEGEGGGGGGGYEEEKRVGRQVIASTIVDDLQLAILVTLLYIFLEMVPLEKYANKVSGVFAKIPSGTGVILKALVAGIVIFVVKVFFLQPHMTTERSFVYDS